MLIGTRAFTPGVRRIVAIARTARPGRLLAACVGIALGLAPTVAAAEWLADLYLGAAFTQRHEVTTETPSGTTSHADVGFNRSAAFGGRAGHWFDFFGIALDVSHFRPDTIPSSLQRFDLYVTPLTLDLMLRWPLLVSPEHPHGQLQPFIAAGPSAGYIEGKDTSNFAPPNQFDARFVVGAQAEAGGVWEFRPNLALLAEYRFTHFSPDLHFTNGRFQTTSALTMHSSVSPCASDPRRMRTPPAHICAA
jgi:hypothetical protein